MSSSKAINVYWAPAVSEDIEFHNEMNMLYPNPENMFSHLVDNRSSFVGNSSLITCPSVKNKLKNTFVFKNGINSKYEYKTNIDGIPEIKTTKENSHNIHSDRVKNLSFGPTLTINAPYIFFAEESLTATFSQPFFHKINYSQYGSIIPGTFDIGSWFRPFSLEFQMWQDSGILEINEDEPCHI